MPDSTSVVLTVPQLLGLLIAVLGSFTGTFFALQRYVGNKLDEGLDRFDKHAEKLEHKVDRVVQGLGDLKVALEGSSREHSTKLDGLQSRVDRIDSRLSTVERGR